MKTFKVVSLKLHQRLIRILFNYLLNNFSKKVIFYAHMISIQSNLIVVNLELFSILLIYLPWKTNWTLFPYFINTLCNLKKRSLSKINFLKFSNLFLISVYCFGPTKNVTVKYQIIPLKLNFCRVICAWCLNYMFLYVFEMLFIVVSFFFLHVMFQKKNCCKIFYIFEFFI